MFSTFPRPLSQETDDSSKFGEKSSRKWLLALFSTFWWPRIQVAAYLIAVCGLTPVEHVTSKIYGIESRVNFHLIQYRHLRSSSACIMDLSACVKVVHTVK